MHRAYVEALVAAEEAALRADQSLDGLLVRLERRGVVLVAEARRVAYAGARLGHTGRAVPLFGQRRETTIIICMRCDNYDTDPPALTFVTDWGATTDLPFAAWPKGSGIIARHHATGRPFVCRPGLREFHTHLQHGDQPWDRFRSRLRPRDVLGQLARDLCTKQVLA